MTTSRTFRTSIIENEHAYQAAIHRNIIANAQKTWRKNNPEHCDAIESFLMAGRGENARGETTYTNNFVGSLAKAFDSYGKLSEKQGSAIVKIIADQAQKRVERMQAIEAQKARSAFLGVESEKITTRAYVEAVLIVDAPKFSYYDSASALVYLMRDEAGNKLVYKSKSSLAFKFQYSKKCVERFENTTREGNVIIIHDEAFIDIHAGMTIDFTATIKAHAENKGEKQTIVQRVKVSGLEFKEGAIKELIDKRS
jgi:hypothetical protein